MRHIRPDNRPDWRDPNMPVYNSGMKQYVPGEYVSELCSLRYEADGSVHPRKESYWRNDPTYNLRNRKR